MAAHRASAAQETRSQLRSLVRNDWQYPDPPRLSRDLTSATIYVEPQISLSPSPSPPHSPVMVATPTSPPASSSGGRLFHRRGSSNKSLPGTSGTGASDPYRFADPHAVGDAVEKKILKRKRAVQDEMQVNEGLRHFVERRNAWTGGVLLPRPIQAGESFTKEKLLSEGVEFPPSAGGPGAMMSIHNDDPPTTGGVVPTTLIPLPPPLVPATHPVREHISESTYPSIYTKVVLQSTTPTIPIGLPDMINALVQGWKNDGEWPPKPGPLDPLVGRRRKRDVIAVTPKVKGDLIGSEEVLDPEAMRAGKVVGVVGRVKKALGLGHRAEKAGDEMEKEKVEAMRQLLEDGETEEANKEDGGLPEGGGKKV